jgi:hypothetical protein
MAEASGLPRRYSEHETASAIGVSVASLRRLERAGKIASFRPVPRRIYYLEHAIREFMELQSACRVIASPLKGISSADTTSLGGRNPATGAGLGTTPTRRAVPPSSSLSARQILRRPRPGSLDGGP